MNTHPDTGLPRAEPPLKLRFNPDLIPRLVCFALGILLLPFGVVGSVLLGLAILDTFIRPIPYSIVDYRAMGLPVPAPDQSAYSYCLRLGLFALLALVPFACVLGMAFIVGLLVR